MERGRVGRRDALEKRSGGPEAASIELQTAPPWRCARRPYDATGQEVTSTLEVDLQEDAIARFEARWCSHDSASSGSDVNGAGGEERA